VKLEMRPSECTGIEEIRMRIDEVDQEIIRLFALRSEYVHEIVKFKTDEESVIAQKRKDLVIKLRGEWAENSGLDKRTFEQLYLLLLDRNISEELVILEKIKK